MTFKRHLWRDVSPQENAHFGGHVEKKDLKLACGLHPRSFNLHLIVQLFET